MSSVVDNSLSHWRFLGVAVLAEAPQEVTSEVHTLMSHTSLTSQDIRTKKFTRTVIISVADSILALEIKPHLTLVHC